MLETNNVTPIGAPRRAYSRLASAPFAADRLTSVGLITQEEWDSQFGQESAAWDDICQMEEAELDALLGEKEVTAINSKYETVPPIVDESAKMEIVESPPPAVEPDEHYAIRQAGMMDGFYGLTDDDLDSELRAIRKLLMQSGGVFLLSDFKDLREFINEGRMLVVEKLGRQGPEIIGVVAYELVQIQAVDTVEKGAAAQRINFIRLLAVKSDTRRRHIAEMLCHEAMLRGTARSIYDEGPQCIGTMGLIFENDAPAQDWVAKLGDNVRCYDNGSKAALSGDPTLVGFRDVMTGWIRELAPELSSRKFKLVAAKRSQLIKAAQSFVDGCVDFAERQTQSTIRVDYEAIDPHIVDLHDVALCILRRNTTTWRSMGLSGPKGEGPWGREATESMSIPLTKVSQSISENQEQDAA